MKIIIWLFLLLIIAVNAYADECELKMEELNLYLKNKAGYGVIQITDEMKDKKICNSKSDFIGAAEKLAHTFIFEDFIERAKEKIKKKEGIDALMDIQWARQHLDGTGLIFNQTDLSKKAHALAAEEKIKSAEKWEREGFKTQPAYLRAQAQEHIKASQ